MLLKLQPPPLFMFADIIIVIMTRMVNTDDITKLFITIALTKELTGS